MGCSKRTKQAESHVNTRPDSDSLSLGHLFESDSCFAPQPLNFSLAGFKAQCGSTPTPAHPHLACHRALHLCESREHLGPTAAATTQHQQQHHHQHKIFKIVLVLFTYASAQHLMAASAAVLQSSVNCSALSETIPCFGLVPATQMSLRRGPQHPHRHTQTQSYLGC